MQLRWPKYGWSNPNVFTVHHTYVTCSTKPTVEVRGWVRYFTYRCMTQSQTVSAGHTLVYHEQCFSTLHAHCSNAWVTSTTFCSCIYVTKKCYQIGFLEIHWGAFPWVNVAGLFFPFGCIPAWYLHATMQPRNSLVADVYQRSGKAHQKCWFMCFLKGDTNLTKEGSLSTILWFKL